MSGAGLSSSSSLSAETLAGVIAERAEALHDFVSDHDLTEASGPPSRPLLRNETICNPCECCCDPKCNLRWNCFVFGILFLILSVLFFAPVAVIFPKLPESLRPALYPFIFEVGIQVVGAIFAFIAVFLRKAYGAAIAAFTRILSIISIAIFVIMAVLIICQEEDEDEPLKLFYDKQEGKATVVLIFVVVLIFELYAVIAFLSLRRQIWVGVDLEPLGPLGRAKRNNPKRGGKGRDKDGRSKRQKRGRPQQQRPHHHNRAVMSSPSAGFVDTNANDVRI